MEEVKAGGKGGEMEDGCRNTERAAMSKVRNGGTSVKAMAKRKEAEMGLELLRLILDNSPSATPPHHHQSPFPGAAQPERTTVKGSGPFGRLLLGGLTR